MDVLLLEIEQPGDDLQVVFDAVVDFLEQDVFFRQGFADAALGFHAFGDVLVHTPVALEAAGLVVPGHAIGQQAGPGPVPGHAPADQVAKGFAPGLGRFVNRPQGCLFARGQEVEGGLASSAPGSQPRTSRTLALT